MRTPTAPAAPRASLARMLAEGPLVLDGAMGTELEDRGVDTRHALWSARALLEAPDVVGRVHADYAAHGARVLTTASYQASVPTFEAAGLSAERARRALSASVSLARGAAEQAGQQVLVVGGIGPFGAHLADGSEYTGAYDVSAPAFEAVHRSRIECLAAQGLRDYAVETVPRLDEAREVVALLRELVPGAECWVSFQVRPDGAHLADGTPLAEAGAWAQEQEGVVAVGVNCVAPQVVEPALAVLREATSKPLVAYPNSGERYDPLTRTWSAVSVREMLPELLGGWLALGARLIGGCCRTTPADTAALSAALARG